LRRLFALSLRDERILKEILIFANWSERLEFPTFSRPLIQQLKRSVESR
jgi:hypothetical protein